MPKPRRYLENRGRQEVDYIKLMEDTNNGIEIPSLYNRTMFVPSTSQPQGQPKKVINKGNINVRREKSIISNITDGAIDYLNAGLTAPIRGVVSVSNFINNLFDKKDTYANAVVPFGEGPGHERDNIINVSNGVKGQRDRLGMYGAVRGKDGIYRFRNPNYKNSDDYSNLEDLRKELGFDNNSEFLIWCAENANRLNQAMGRPTAGNAWTRHGIYGDSAIVEAPYKKSDYWFGGEGIKAKHLASDQGDYVADNIDKHELMTGDIVDMYYRGSDFLNRAFREGDNNRTNSHTGTILRTGRDKEHTYVVHSTGNGLQVQPIGELLGSGMFKKSYITGIRRPGTRKHIYK